MSPSIEIATAGAPLPEWLRLEHLSPFDAYAQAMGTGMLTVALLQLLCSFYADARALRIFALLYLLTGIGWLVAHPRAHGGAGDVPMLPAMVAVVLIGMNVWGMYEFLGLARQRVVRLVLGTVCVGAILALSIRLGATDRVVYAAMAGGFALCAVLAARAARHEGNVGHLYIAAAYATYPLMFLACLAFPAAMAGFELGYYAAVPGLIVGVTILAVSLIRARRRTETELTRRVAAEDSLRQLNATLEDRVAARTRELNDLVAGLESFNRNVSHDLRDPLAGVAGLAQLGAMALQRGEIGKAQSHLQTIHDQAAQMTGMVQDLLQLSKAADAPLQRSLHDLRRCVDEALQQLRLQPPMAEALRRVQLQVRPLPVCRVDPDLMRQVFVNLLGNALKFTAGRGGDGHIAVALQRRADGAALCVEDDGLGLPDGREAELFKPFARLHAGQGSGSGIGLTVVRRIVEAHGGRIWAERVAPRGARFVFTLDGLRA
jgi:signal transduction histidine kinase